jgi:hypothetical protein
VAVSRCPYPGNFRAAHSRAAPHRAASEQRPQRRVASELRVVAHSLDDAMVLAEEGQHAPSEILAGWITSGNVTGNAWINSFTSHFKLRAAPVSRALWILDASAALSLSTRVLSRAKCSLRRSASWWGWYLSSHYICSQSYASPIAFGFAVACPICPQNHVMLEAGWHTTDWVCENAVKFGGPGCLSGMSDSERSSGQKCFTSNCSVATGSVSHRVFRVPADCIFLHVMIIRMEQNFLLLWISYFAAST